MKKRIIRSTVAFAVGATILWGISTANTFAESTSIIEQRAGVVPQWENLGNFNLVPSPKEIVIFEDSIPLNDQLLIVTGNNPSVITLSAAQDLARVIEEKTAVAVTISNDSSTITGKNVILLGTQEEFELLESICIREGKSPKDMESQGYRIFGVKENGLHRLVLAGRDAQGVYWAAMTVADLIDNGSIRIAEVTDWPDFKWRKADALSDILMVYKNSGNKNTTLELAKRRIHYAARNKLNFLRTENMARSHSGPRTDYLTDDRAEVLGEIGDYALSRGMKLHVKVRTATGVIGRDEERFPQVEDCVREMNYYYTWSNEELIDFACQRITEMVEIIGPHIYVFHPPDIPNIGWERRSQEDRDRWGDDRIAAETWLANRMHEALKKGNPEARMVYLYQPYNPTHYFYSQDSESHLQNLARYEEKLDPDIGIVWREHSAETAQQLRNIQGDRPIMYWIENNSFHRNRLAGGIPRTYKSYLFENDGRDMVVSNVNVMSFQQHLPTQGIHAEYLWNTHAPDSVYVHTSSEAVQAGSRGSETSILEDGTDFWTWIYGPDLEGVVSDELLPRICRKIFGTDTGGAMAVAYSSGGTIHEDRLGGTAFSTREARFRNSDRSANLLTIAAEQLKEFWCHPELFDNSLFDTYAIYRSVFKYALVYQHIERINAYTQMLHYIGETGEGANQLDSLHAEALAYIRDARAQLAHDYAEYGLNNIVFRAIYRQNIGSLENVNLKIDRLQNEIEFRMEVIEQYGFSGIPRISTTLGIIPAESAITIDGNLSEWDLSNPVIVDKTHLVPWSEPIGATRDFDQISYWFFQHDENYLYLAALVYDDDHVFEHDSALHRNDSVEFWLDRGQVVVSRDSFGKTRVESYAYGGGGRINPNEIEAVITTGTGIYPFHPDESWWVAEVKIPLSQVGLDVTDESGFHMAFGTNDSDTGQPATQFYFPDSYEHLRRAGSALEDFATAILLDNQSVPANVRVDYFELYQQAVADGTYTCFDLNFSLELEESVPGVYAEVRMHTDEGIRRYNLDFPSENNLLGSTVSVNVNTGEFYHNLDAIHAELVISTPWEQKTLVLQKGSYPIEGTHFISRDRIRVRSEGTGQSSHGNDEDLLFYASFDDESPAGVGSHPFKMIDARDTSYVEGRSGKAVRIGEGGYILYEQDSINPEGATISFWFKPLFEPEDHRVRTILKLFDNYNQNRVYLYNNANFSYTFSVKGEKESASVSFKPNLVRSDTWNHFEISWNTAEGTVSFMINGNKKTVNVELDITNVSRHIFLGASDRSGTRGASCLIDEFRVRKNQR